MFRSPLRNGSLKKGISIRKGLVPSNTCVHRLPTRLVIYHVPDVNSTADPYGQWVSSRRAIAYGQRNNEHTIVVVKQVRIQVSVVNVRG